MEIDPRFFSSLPRRVLRWKEDDQGSAVLLRCRFGENPWGRRLAGWLRTTDYRIRLDPIGTLIWKSCDGETPLSVILQRLRQEFGEEIEPAEERLYLFIRQLTKSHFIRF